MALPANYFVSVREASSTVGTVDDINAANWLSSGLNGSNLGMGITDTPGTLTFDLAAGLASGWISVCFARSGTFTVSGGPHEFITLSGPTTDLFRCVTTASGASQWNLEYWDGATWQTAGSTVTSPTVGQSAAFRLDIFFNVNDTGEISAYVNGSGTPVATFSGDTFTTADTTIDSVTLGNYTTQFHTCYYSTLVVDTADTRDLFIEQATTTALGALSEWDVSTENNVDEWHWSMDMVTNINTSASGDRVTYSYASLPANATGKTIDGVAIYALGQGLGDPSLFVDGLTYISATPYESATASFQFSNSEEQYTRWEFPTDPSTASPWANAAAVEAAQFGFITKLS